MATASGRNVPWGENFTVGEAKGSGCRSWTVVLSVFLGEPGVNSQEQIGISSSGGVCRPVNFGGERPTVHGKWDNGEGEEVNVGERSRAIL